MQLIISKCQKKTVIICQEGKIQRLKNIRWQKKLRERYEEKERFISFIDCSEYSGRYGLVLKRTI